MMLQAITLDTFKVIKEWKQAGFSEKQAGVQTNVLKQALSEFQNNKNKLQELATKADILTLKAEMIKWIAGLLIAQGVFIVSIIKLIW